MCQYDAVLSYNYEVLHLNFLLLQVFSGVHLVLVLFSASSIKPQINILSKGWINEKHFKMPKKKNL